MEGTTMSDIRRMMMMFTRPVDSGGSTVPVPTISPSAGAISPTQTISISISGIATLAEYSFDNQIWTTYSNPFTLPSATTVYARATDGDGNYSDVVSNSYTIAYDAEVEYLQSSGTQYIQLPDVTYSSSNKYVFEGHLNFASNPTSNQLMGWNAGGIIGWIKSKGWWDGYNTNKYISAPYNTDAKISLTVNSGASTYSVLSIDGYTSLSRPHSSITNYAKSNPYTLFGYWSNTTFTKISIRIHDFKVYINDILVHDLIAVRKDGIGYMYDNISKELFGNDGTGSFTYGNDITN